MSFAKLSQATQTRIIKTLAENIKRDEKAANELGLTTFVKGEVRQVVVGMNDSVRALSNQKQTGIFSKDLVDILTDNFKDIASGKIRIGSRILTNKGYLSKTIKRYPALYKHILDNLKMFKSSAHRNRVDLSKLQEITDYLSNQVILILKDPNLYEEFLDYVKTTELGQGTSLKYSSGESFQILGKQHGEINKLFSQFLKTKKNVNEAVVEFFDANIDAGHFLGVFNQKLFRWLGSKTTNLDQISMPGDIEAEFIDASEAQADEDLAGLAAINRLNAANTAGLQLAEYVDYLSSSLKLSPTIFAALSKQVYGGGPAVSAVSAELSLDNSALGSLLRDAGADLREAAKLAKQAAEQAFKNDAITLESGKKLEMAFKNMNNIASAATKLAQSLKSIDNQRLRKFADDIIKKIPEISDTLLNVEGSDSVKTSIKVRVERAIDGKPLPPQSTTKAKAELKQPKTTVKKPVKKPVPAKITAAKTAIKLQSKKAPTAIRAKTGQFYSLASLQVLMDSVLSEVIEENMGNGRRRDILNLQTGRFAQSVKVEKLSQSREGMIIAFYTYMKNPYQTFEPGYRQGYPLSRDPKLLISKSIREIAATKVGNKIRAVRI